MSVKTFPVAQLSKYRDQVTLLILCDICRKFPTFTNFILEFMNSIVYIRNESFETQINVHRNFLLLFSLEEGAPPIKFKPNY